MDIGFITLACIQAANLGFFRWVVRVYFAQPKWMHPVVFRRPLSRAILGYGPIALFVALIALGFWVTQSPWIFLMGSIAGWIAFSANPSPIEAAVSDASNEMELGTKSELSSAEVIAGTLLHMQALELANRAMQIKRYEIGLLEVEARMGLPEYFRASPNTQRNFMALRETLKFLLAVRDGVVIEQEPARDLVEALVGRRQTFLGTSIPMPMGEYWKASPEFQVLYIVRRISVLCIAGLSEQEALESLRKGRVIGGASASQICSIEQIAANTFSGEIASAEHVGYVLRLARRISVLRN
jgi:hypothetical protein